MIRAWPVDEHIGRFSTALQTELRDVIKVAESGATRVRVRRTTWQKLSKELYDYSWSRMDGPCVFGSMTWKGVPLIEG